MTTIWLKYVKNIVNVVLDIFLNFVNVSSYLTSMFARKNSCTISFELQMSQIE